MPKAKITAETVEVLKQAEAAANDPAPQPNQQQPNANEEKKKFITELKANRDANRDRLLVAKDIVKTLEANQKELDEQYLDAIKNTPDEYKSILQDMFNF